MAKKLIINIDEITACKDKLKTAAEELKDVQETLQKAIETMDSLEGWKSQGSAAFLNKYNTSWVSGVTDRYDVMIRMCEHLENAIKEYTPVAEETERLRLELPEQ